MPEKRYAILIGNGRYKNHPNPSNLRCTTNDVNALANIFRDKSKGAFDDVLELIDQDAQSIKLNIFRKLQLLTNDDLLLIYYTGHGKLNRLSKLYLVATDTNYKELEPTSLPISEIIEYLKTSNCKKIGIILDCCYSGAIINGFVAKGNPDEVNAQLNAISGYGIRVMTASSSIQTAAELEGDNYSLLTKYLIEGVTSGEADTNFTGKISFNDLFHFARARVVEEGFQEPTISELDSRSEFIVSYNGKSLRKEQSKIIEKKLFELLKSKIIPQNIYDSSLVILNEELKNLSPNQIRYDDLLNRFNSGTISIANLIYEWGKLDSVNNAPSIKNSTTQRRPYPHRLHIIRFGIFLSILVVIFPVSLRLLNFIYTKLDSDPHRGAIEVKESIYDESFKIPTYLDQGWAASESLWFYNTTQGSNLLPYDFFLSLETGDSETPFTDTSVYDRHRLLPQKPTFFNPDGLAVGLVKDSFKGKSFVGFTCAACHTSQINYKGSAIRIDGGAGSIDYVGYLNDLSYSLDKTLKNPEKYLRFSNKVLKRKGHYEDDKSIKDDLIKYKNRLNNFLYINHSNINSGFGRLDLYSTIGNTVISMSMSMSMSKHALRDFLIRKKDHENKYIFKNPEINLILNKFPSEILSEDQINILFDELRTIVGSKKLQNIKQDLFITQDSPVSIPPLWYTDRYDFIMWNGLTNNSELGPLYSNTQKVLATLPSVATKKDTNSSSILNNFSEKSNREEPSLSIESSIDLVNLVKLENIITSLESPKWPSDIFGEIDKEKATRGEVLYELNCSLCHERNIARVKLIKADEIGTDPMAALSPWLKRTHTGAYQNSIYRVGSENKRLGNEESLSLLAKIISKKLLMIPDQDKIVFRRAYEWIELMMISFYSNTNVRISADSDKYYLARPLSGIWATAPYLHNGSIPSLYDLLLPYKMDNLSDQQYRPNEFVIGSREFDPIKVGFKSSGYDGFIFKSSSPGNFNSGHTYGTNLTNEERWELVEFLKTL